MSRAQKAVLYIRVCLVLLSLAIGILVLGPFAHAEESFGLTDKEAHIIAFFSLTLMLQLAFPRVRRMDMALGVLLLGALIEVVQLFTGRSASVGDWLADLIGVSVATIPSYAETFRHFARLGVNMPRRRPADAALARVPHRVARHPVPPHTPHHPPRA
ncbi:VanZ family protein [Asticcacaulis sp. AND118]|uniref:VanZ family protein n=1 Tax=Asticcacaulis sp. AND118 TaxID=2840468 RepID=UPI001CFFBB71|nr:VanZ family protein [Asticcacaulis sp. AND118]UDF03361.1 VanZ family protein [Asticcacaulis sp. AND118]